MIFCYLTLQKSALLAVIYFLQLQCSTLVLCAGAGESSFASDSGQHIVSGIKFLRSYQNLRYLAAAEKNIYDGLNIHFANTTTGIGKETSELLSYLEDYENSSGRVVIDEPNNFEHLIASNPLFTTRMLYRYVIDILQVLLSVSHDPVIHDFLQRSLDILHYSIGLPTTLDCQEMYRAILRVVHVYDLKVPEFGVGVILGTKTGTGLRAKHCIEIAKCGIAEKYFAQAVEWAELAKILVTEHSDESISFEEIQNVLITASQTHDLEWELVPNNSNRFFTQQLKYMINPDLRQTRRAEQYKLWKGRRAINFNEINFWGLCSGDDLRTEEEKSKLFCWYDFNSNPAWYINPLKIEQLSKSPDLRQIYEVVGDNMIDKLIRTAARSMQRSFVSAPEGLQHTETRTSASTWINDWEPEFLSIPRKIELLTDLIVVPTNSSEQLQIASYTFGGHYEVHVDTSKDTQQEINAQLGLRMATFMIYLTDVELGGYTAFAQAGIAARPVKGSAVFWYNLKRNGEIVENAYHGACPIILGNKWVGNKWIRTYEQFLKRTCSLNPND